MYEAYSDGRNRVERSGSHGTTLRIMNGGKVAILRPDGSVFWPSQINTFSERPDYILALSVLSNYMDQSTTLEYRSASDPDTDIVDFSTTPLDQSDKQAVYKEITGREFSIDRKSGLVTKLAYRLELENSTPGSATIELAFSDYRPVDRLLLPFKIVTSIDGEQVSTVEFKEIRFNVGIPSASFELPNGLPKEVRQ